MVRNIVVLGGNSHPKFTENVCEILGIPPSRRILEKFSCGESRCEIRDSVRGKDVYIIQTFGCGEGGDCVNDHFIELCIMISACKTGSARRVTAVLPLFPYSRQPDLRFNKAGAPLKSTAPAPAPAPGRPANYTFESIPATPAPSIPRTAGLGSGVDITELVNRARPVATAASQENGSANGVANGHGGISTAAARGSAVQYTTHDYENLGVVSMFKARPGYKQWIAQAGTLIANLLTCAGADRVLTCDLHESTYQGFFDIPVDNLYGRTLIQRYIRQKIENYKDAVIVSPDAGGAKRATAIADALGLNFALIHKVDERSIAGQTVSPTQQQQPQSPLLQQQQQQQQQQMQQLLLPQSPGIFAERQKATMMLVGNVAGRRCILVDDLVDTGNTITRAARLLRAEGAASVEALITHGVFSGDALARIEASALDRVVVTNTVAQDAHAARCAKLEVLDVAPFFAEGIRRLHHGESISVLFQYD